MRKEKRELQNKIAKNLSRSMHWLTVRMDEDLGLEIQSSSAYAVDALLALWLKNDPETYGNLEKLMREAEE